VLDFFEGLLPAVRMFLEEKVGRDLVINVICKKNENLFIFVDQNFFDLLFHSTSQWCCSCFVSLW